jgi:hypothetical protein
LLRRDLWHLLFYLGEFLVHHRRQLLGTVRVPSGGVRVEDRNRESPKLPEHDRFRHPSMRPIAA